jgi:uncharacterized membrane protein
MKWMFEIRGVEIPLITLIIFFIAAFWTLGIIIAPLTLPSNSVPDLSPNLREGEGVGSVDHANITKDMNPFAKFFYERGDVDCHTIKERSFSINGNQMPYCVRDFGLFAGLALGLGIALFKRFEIKIWWLILGIVPLGVDGTVQLLTSYESNNPVRLLTGLLAGTVIMLALGWVLYDLSKGLELKNFEIPVHENHDDVAQIETDNEHRNH